MTIDLTPQFPTTFDFAHIVLASIAVILFFAYLLKSFKRSFPNTASDAEIDVSPSTKTTDTEVKQIDSTDVSTVKETSPDSALQLLGLLQQEARLIDFVQEEIAAYSDDEVGAAARVVHEGSQKVINEYFTLSPIRTEEEESSVTLAEGFDASKVRLTGNVVGTAPFTGTLIHRGWHANEVKLPKLSTGHDTTIVAAAEVEL